MENELIYIKILQIMGAEDYGDGSANYSTESDNEDEIKEDYDNEDPDGDDHASQCCHLHSHRRSLRHPFSVIFSPLSMEQMEQIL